VLEGQLGAALWTETPRALRGRSEPRGLTAHKPELRPSYAEPRDERSASGSTTDRTMAVCLMKGCARCLITDPSAKASALEHSITCRFPFLDDRSAFADRSHADYQLRSGWIFEAQPSRITALILLPRTLRLFLHFLPLSASARTSDAESSHEGLECCPLHAQAHSSAGWSANHPARFTECAQDMLSFSLF
jgi:hypothetical protein